jgi:amino acid adenylation domain-containing protein
MKVLERFYGHGAPALLWGGTALGPDVLRARVCGAADWLRARLAPGDRVALHLPHGPDAPVLLLACWQADLVAVPLDLHHPPERLGELLERSGARLFVTSGRRGAALARRLGGEALVIDGEWPLPVGGAPRWCAAPDAPALILWTSGSTGAPKGVTIGRGAIDAVVAHWRDRLGIGPADRVAWTAALTFDLSLLDLGVAWTAGATLVPLPEARLAFPAELGAWIEEAGITCIYSVPSLLERALPEGRMPPSLRVVLSAGEALPAGLARRLRAALPEHGLLGNLFGPTETNVSTAWMVPPGWSGERVPIGRPCPYVRVRLVDDELLVTGDTVMQGYWGEPARARWDEYANARWLHTGDRARWDGEELVFLGRADRMVKVRGYRVEPEEVERALLALAGVAEAAVLVTDAGGEARLEACVVGEVDAEGVLTALARVLPGWACPDRIRVLPALPRTPRGKVDREALRGG